MIIFNPKTLAISKWLRFSEVDEVLAPFSLVHCIHVCSIRNLRMCLAVVTKDLLNTLKLNFV
jgi:hypothetical protein